MLSYHQPRMKLCKLWGLYAVLCEPAVSKTRLQRILVFKKKKKKKTRLKSEYQAQTDIKKVSTYAQTVAVEQALTPQLPCL